MVTINIANSGKIAPRTSQAKEGGLPFLRTEQQTITFISLSPVYIQRPACARAGISLDSTVHPIISLNHPLPHAPVSAGPRDPFPDTLSSWCCASTAVSTPPLPTARRGPAHAPRRLKLL